jgi:hypothetical protein
MRYLLLIITGVVFFTSCKNNSYYIPESELVDILVDIHMSEGITNVEFHKFSEPVSKYRITNDILEMHGVEMERFDSTMHYYAQNINKYDAIYDKVIKKLILIETKIKAGEFDKSNLFSTLELIHNTFPQDSLLKDSVLKEFWWEDRDISITKTSKTDKLTFSQNYVISNHTKALLLRADILIYPDDCIENPEMILNVNVENDTDSILSKTIFIVKDTLPKMYELYVPLCDSLNVIDIEGSFFEYKACDAKRHAEINNIRIYEIVDSGNPILIPSVSLLNTSF